MPSNAPVAQWIERWPPKPKVSGSSPVGRISPTKSVKTINGAIMRLENAILQSRTCQEFCDILDRRVNVQIDSLWGVDTVAIDGYEGTVSTDLIAEQITKKFGHSVKENEEEAGLRLADLLKEKVFIPLRERVKELDVSNCIASLAYKIRNSARLGFTPTDRNLTEGYLVLKHSMCVMYLDKSL